MTNEKELSLALTALRHNTLDIASCLKKMPREICYVNLQIKVLADFFIRGISPLKSVSPDLNTYRTEKSHSWALKKCNCIIRIKLWIHSFP